MAPSFIRRLRLGTALSAATLVAAATAAVGLPAANAASATDSQTGTQLIAKVGTTRNCVILLDKIKPGETTSHVRARECATGRMPSIASSGTLLMTWFQLANYGGESTYVEGSDGPCDIDGYGFRDVGAGSFGYWDNRISSFKVFNRCYYSVAYNGTNYGGDRWQAYEGNVSYVGDYMNNRISSMTIHSG